MCLDLMNHMDCILPLFLCCDSLIYAALVSEILQQSPTAATMRSWSSSLVPRSGPSKNVTFDKGEQMKELSQNRLIYGKRMCVICDFFFSFKDCCEVVDNW